MTAVQPGVPAPVPPLARYHTFTMSAKEQDNSIGRRKRDNVELDRAPPSTRLTH